MNSIRLDERDGMMRCVATSKEGKGKKRGPVQKKTDGEAAATRQEKAEGMYRPGIGGMVPPSRSGARRARVRVCMLAEDTTGPDGRASDAMSDDEHVLAREGPKNTPLISTYLTTAHACQAHDTASQATAGVEWEGDSPARARNTKAR